MKVAPFLLMILAAACPLAASEAIEYSGYYSDLVRQTPELDDKTRIPLHFNFLLKKFRAKNLNSLSFELRAAREMNLKHLEEYRDQGRFPINGHVAWRQPVFIDNDGTHCAVGYLVMASGHPQAAKAISKRENLAYLKDIKSPELDLWIAASGLSREECAMIQPSYCVAPFPTATVIPHPATQSAEVYFYKPQIQPGFLRVRAFTLHPIKEARLILSFNDGRPDQSVAFTSAVNDDLIYAPMETNGAGELSARLESVCSSDPTASLLALGAWSVNYYSCCGYSDAMVPLRKILDLAMLPGISSWSRSMNPFMGSSCDLPNPQNPETKAFDVCFEVLSPANISRAIVSGKDAFGAALDADAYFEIEEVDDNGVSLDANKEIAKGNLMTDALTLQFISLPLALFSFCPDSLKPPIPTPAPTATPMPALCGPRVEKVVVAPSPLYKIAGSNVAVYISGCASKLRCHVYSSSSRHIKSWEVPASGVQGWQSTPLPDGLEIANGQYFIKVEAFHGDKRDSGTSGFYVVK